MSVNRVRDLLLYLLCALGLSIVLTDVMTVPSLKTALENVGWTATEKGAGFVAFLTAVLLCLLWYVALGRRFPRRAMAVWPFGMLAFCPLSHWLGLHWVPVLILIVSAALFLALLVGAPWRGSPWSVALAVAAYSGCFITLGLLQYASMNVMYGDTAVFEEILWRTLHGEFMRSSNFSHNFLGEHVQLSLFYFLPVYAFFPDLRTLMILQSMALGSGAVPVYLLGRRLTDPRCAFSVAIAYLLYPALQYLNLEGGGALHAFRPENLSVPLLLWMIYFFEAERLGLAAVFAVLALFCKEEYGLVLLAFGVYAALRKRTRFGLALGIGGLAWLVISLLVVIPYFRGGISHTLTYYSDLSADPGNPTLGSLLLGILSHPGRPLRLLADGERIQLLLHLLVPFGFLSLLGWRVLAISLPSVLVCMLSQREATFWPLFHYHAPLIPFFTVAALHGLRKVRNRSLMCALVVFSALTSNVLLSKSPLSLRFYDPSSQSNWRSLYLPTPHSRKLAKVRALIPLNSRVSASLFLATYFTHHRECWLFSRGVEQADYVAIDLTERWIENQADAIRKVWADPRFEALYSDDGYLVLRRRAP